MVILQHTSTGTTFLTVTGFRLILFQCTRSNACFRYKETSLARDVSGEKTIKANREKFGVPLETVGCEKNGENVYSEL